MTRQRFTLVPAVYLIIRQDDKVLLIRRANTGYYDGMYALPAGHVDGNEPAHRAAIREAKEEVGLTIREEDLRFVHVMHRVAEEGDHERVDFFFEVLKYEGEPFNAEPEKCDNVAWFDLDDLPKNISPISRLALKASTEGRTYSHDNF